MVILEKSRWNPAKFEKLARIWRNPANPLLQRHVLGQICSSSTSLGPKKIRKKRKKKKSRPYLVRINVHDSSKSLLKAFWEKNLKAPTLKEIKTLGEVHCEFLNIGSRIENRLKL
jgi:hypothetical protein